MFYNIGPRGTIYESDFGVTSSWVKVASVKGRRRRKEEEGRREKEARKGARMNNEENVCACVCVWLPGRSLPKVDWGPSRLHDLLQKGPGHEFSVKVASRRVSPKYSQ